ncbi:NAD(P)-dependent dehydrogenase, short-chain alcohol dehydrogenase family [Thalassovita litoralis]|uniref:NAD(P)-dependent dehydrogenase, short-chain alcohol dehydrogenase family n=1 Tax=Thalassovita litoralis TaxID=1010611 RepID=A0A521BNU4_9RHOB|nr:SDR family oxidoreductase [Thalassovita litoralis]SMO48270.1 NAD(P)-dependent dehydrogenase, short-chain alcohol dehydrogenase family [Thalassovita litoralis]
MSEFADAVIAITGGASGIGAACAEVLAARGARVAILDRNIEQAQEVATRLGGTAIHVDVADEQSVADAFAQVETDMGPMVGGITSAGIVQTPKPPSETDMQVFDQIYQVNFRGTFLSLREMAKYMLPRRAGSLVALSSITARRSTPLHAYGPGKAAVTNLIGGLAAEWGRAGLRVNAIEPGYTRTPALQVQIDLGHRDISLMNENSTLGRMVEPSEIGTVAAFLLSRDASAVTGVSMAVDAGFYHVGSWAPYGGVRSH